MKHRSFKNANLIGWIIIILGFSFLYFSYFFIYIPRQEDQLRQRAFRILKEYGSNIFDKHNYYKNHFKNYAPYYGIQHFGFKKNARVNEPVSTEVQKVIDELFSITTEVKLRPNNYWPDSFKIADNQVHLRFHNEIKEVNLFKIENLINESNLDSLKECGLLTNVPVNHFMKGLKFDQLFENIILFADSQVYYNSNEDVLIDLNNPQALSDSIKGMQGGTYLKVDVRGEDKHIIILPIQFIGKEFFLAGFIPDKEFRDITRTINNQLLIFLAGLLLLVFVGMPVLKVIFLSQNERLKSLDASSSVFSAIIGTGLLVLLAISFLKHQFSDRLYNFNRIQVVSDSLYFNVKSNFDSIKNLYFIIDSLGRERVTLSVDDSIKFVSSDTTLLGFLDSHFFSTEKKLQDTILKKHYEDYNKILNSDRTFFQDTTLKSPFPLNEILLINDSGKISKAITRTPFSDLVEIDLTNRNYFLNIKDTKKAWSSNENLKFFIESIQSYNTGQGETAVSFYTSAFGSKEHVLAITSVIPSLYHQVVPKDVEFLIINDSGKVLYHSIKSKNLHENFLEECESDTRLVTAINLRTEDKFHLNYNGKKWLSRIRPVEDTPLYHITLIDQTPTNNKNARIFLFSFYFFIMSVFILIVGIMIKLWIFPSKNEGQYTWFLKWLDFKSINFLLYKKLILLMSVSIILQVAGIFFLVKPIAVLFYQLFFMFYVIYISKLVIKRKEITHQHWLYGSLFILTFLLIEVLLIWQTGLAIKLVFLGLIFLTVAYATSVVLKNIADLKLSNSSDTKTNQKPYLLFLFLLLANLSIVPVIQFYFSVKSIENQLWQQEQYFKVANDNLLLQSMYEDHEAPWYKKIQGNGIDALQVSFDATSLKPNGSYLLTNADRIYSNLFDPITKSYHPQELFKGKNYTSEWALSDTLLFTRAGKNGSVTVVSGEKAGVDYLHLSVIIFIVFIGISGFLWLLLNYMATVIFNLHPEDKPKSGDKWSKILTDPGKKRILLKSFNGDCYFKNSVDFLNDNNQISEVKKTYMNLKPLHVSQILNGEVKLQEVLESQAVIWISGLDHYIYQVDKHESLLSLFLQVNQSSVQKVIVDMPFDIELISEYYDEYISENELKPENSAQLFILRKRWGYLFKNYYEYDGYIDFNENEHIEEVNTNPVSEDDIEKKCYEEFRENPKAWHGVIWANITNNEKVILYDLADDGLMNRKNKPMIRRLLKKKLIIDNVNPKLFSTEFRDFVLQKLSPSKVKALESSLGLKGKWRNIRYLILLILIPLGAFIFISQGIPMEKIFGIIGGALAAITGLLRLFDSSSFKMSSS